MCSTFCSETILVAASDGSSSIPPQNVSNACNVGGFINEINGFSRIEWVIKANSMVNIVKFKQTHTFSFCANNFHYLFAITHSLVTTYASTYMRWKLCLFDSRCERDMNKTKQKLHAYVASREMRVWDMRAFNRLFIEKENSQFPYRILIHFRYVNYKIHFFLNHLLTLADSLTAPVLFVFVWLLFFFVSYKLNHSVIFLLSHFILLGCLWDTLFMRSQNW